MPTPRWRPAGILGVVHLRALPGDPGHGAQSWAGVLEHAVRDAEALLEGGVDGLVVENFGSAPFVKGTADDRLAAHHVAFMARVAAELRERFAGPLGINCLRNDAVAAIGIAAATGADFVRVNVHVGAYVTDQGVIEGEAAQSLRYRRAIGADRVALLADVLVKHATPLAAVTMAVAVRDTFDRGLADAVIVSGTGTGAPVSLQSVQEARQVAGERPVLVGSGLHPGNVDDLAPFVDGAIVGTFFKQGGDVRAPVDAGRVRTLCTAVGGRLRGR